MIESMANVPSEPKAEVRERILAAARCCFARRGYAATSLRHITEEAKVTKPMIFYYFGSKEGLYRTILESSRARLLARVAHLPDLPGATRDRLIALTRAHQEFATGNPDDVKLLVIALLGPSGGAPEELPGAIPPDPNRDIVARIIEAGIAEGELSTDDAPLLVFSVHAALNGIYAAALRQQPLPGGTSLPDRLVAVLWDGLSPRGLTTP